MGPSDFKDCINTKWFKVFKELDQLNRPIP